MSKNHRGTGLRALPEHGRGVCPICKKSDIKVIYEVEVNGQKIKVCKYCNAALKNKAKKEGPAKAVPSAESTAQ
jgi:hypothetical protein